MVMFPVIQDRSKTAQKLRDTILTKDSPVK
jgi:hypothetical protein